MGVTKLWELLEPSSVDIDACSLAGKTLAIDISGWIYHYVKVLGQEGNPGYESKKSQNIHTMGVFRRICMCLYHDIRPVIVFDGSPPALKVEVLRMRQSLRARADQNIRSIAEQVLHKKMQAYILTGQLAPESMTRRPEHDMYELPRAFQPALTPQAEEENTTQTSDRTRADPLSFDEFDDAEAEEQESGAALQRFLDQQQRPDAQSIFGEQGKKVEEELRTLDEDDEGTQDEEQDNELRDHEEKLHRLLDLQKAYIRSKQHPDALLKYTPDAYSNAQIDKLMNKNKLKKRILNYKSRVSGAATLNGIAVRGISSESDLKYILHTTKDEPKDRPSTKSNTEASSLLKSTPLSINTESAKLLLGGKGNSCTPQVCDIKRPRNIFLDPSPPQSEEEEDESDEDNVFSSRSKTQQSMKKALAVPFVSENVAQPSVKEKKQILVVDDLANDAEQQVDLASLLKNTPAVIELPSETNVKASIPNQENYSRFLSGLTRLGQFDVSSEEESQEEEASEDTDQTEGSDMELASQPKFDTFVVKEPCEESFQGEKVHQEQPQQQEFTREKEFDTKLTEANEPDDAKSWDTGMLKAAIKDKEIYQQQLLASQKQLEAKLRQEEKSSSGIFGYMLEEIKELLVLFGIPYIESPSEAEAQCAQLERLGLTQGTLTDDSDYFLFGGKTAIRHLFSRTSQPAMYRMDLVERKLGLFRSHLIDIALLSGSDYTKGIYGIGPVHSLEVLSEFYNSESKTDYLISARASETDNSSDDPLKNFRDFMRRCQSGDPDLVVDTPTKKRFHRMRKKIIFPYEFPSDRVRDAYLRPNVTKNIDPLRWSPLQEDEIRAFAYKYFQWNVAETDSLLIPARERRGKIAAKDAQSQKLIVDFFSPSLAPYKSISSKRVQKATATTNKKQKR